METLPNGVSALEYAAGCHSNRLVGKCRIHGIYITAIIAFYKMLLHLGSGDIIELLFRHCVAWSGKQQTKNWDQSERHVSSLDSNAYQLVLVAGLPRNSQHCWTDWERVTLVANLRQMAAIGPLRRNEATRACPLSGDRKRLVYGQNDANNPERTLAEPPPGYVTRRCGRVG